MSKVLLVGKGFPDRGGIPTFLNTLRHGELGELHQITFLNVAHFGTPEGGEVTAGNIGRTLRDARNVFRMAKGQDIVHIHSALAPGRHRRPRRAAGPGRSAARGQGGHARPRRQHRDLADHPADQDPDAAGHAARQPRRRRLVRGRADAGPGAWGRVG